MPKTDTKKLHKALREWLAQLPIDQKDDDLVEAFIRERTQPACPTRRLIRKRRK